MGRIIGKQVRCLYDLVTVCGERFAIAGLRQPLALWGWEGGGAWRPASQETCRMLVREPRAPDHEELVVPSALRLPPKGSFIVVIIRLMAAFSFACLPYPDFCLV